MSKRIWQLTCLLLLLPLAACSSIVSDDDYAVTVHTNPEGHTVQVVGEDGKVVHQDQTPFTVTLDTSAGYFDAAEYRFIDLNDRNRETTVEANMDEWYWGNLLFGGVIGFFIVDPATGSMYEFDNHIYLSPPGGVARKSVQEADDDLTP